MRYSYAHKLVMCGDVRFSGSPLVKTKCNKFGIPKSNGDEADLTAILILNHSFLYKKNHKIAAISGNGEGCKK